MKASSTLPTPHPTQRSRPGRHWRSSLAAVPLLASLSAIHAQTLHLLPPLPQGASTYPSGVSADGSVVAGTSFFPSGDADRAFTWTSAGGSQAVNGAPVSFGQGISGDGQTVVGLAFDENFNTWAYRHRNGTMESLGSLDGTGFNAAANDVSHDGAAITGQSTLNGNERAFRWTEAGGMKDLGLLKDGSYALGLGISGDGAVIVGNADTGGASRAFRWTEAGGMKELGTLTGSKFDGAYAISATANTIVGLSAGQAVRWLDGTAQSLGPLADMKFTSAWAVSGDGQLIGGSSYGSPTRGAEAFVWTPSTGMLILEDVLTARGIDLTGWDLEWLTGISADGSTLVGIGAYNGEAAGWAITGLTAIPEPTALTSAVGLLGFGFAFARFGSRRKSSN